MEGQVSYLWRKFKNWINEAVLWGLHTIFFTIKISCCCFPATSVQTQTTEESRWENSHDSWDQLNVAAVDGRHSWNSLAHEGEFNLCCPTQARQTGWGAKCLWPWDAPWRCRRVSRNANALTTLSSRTNIKRSIKYHHIWSSSCSFCL